MTLTLQLLYNMKDKQLVHTLFEIKIHNHFEILLKINQFVNDSANVVGTETMEAMKFYLNTTIFCKLDFAWKIAL